MEICHEAIGERAIVKADEELFIWARHEADNWWLYMTDGNSRQEEFWIL